MKKRNLGRTGIQVSPYCLGTMMFGPAGNPDPVDCHRIIRRALDAGINFIDTADVYGGSDTESIVGAALKGRRDNVVLATKFGGSMGDDTNRSGASRRWITSAVEGSLRRLQVDYIDLYQIHHFDPLTDIEETLAALTDLVKSGKVRAIGSSSFLASDIVEAQWASARNNFARLRTEQPTYSILARGIERDILPVCDRYGMGVLTWSPLAWGLLTGKYRPGQDAAVSSSRNQWGPRHMGDRTKFEAIEALAPVAEEAGISMTHLALAFVTAHPSVTSAIIGPRTLEQLEDIIAGAEIILNDDVLDKIDEIAPPGTDIGVSEVSYIPESLRRSELRRRARSDRSAA